MSRFAERFREEGMQQGIQQGMQQGEARVLERLLTRKFGALPEDARQRITEADEPTLLAWSERVLSASRLEDVLH
jgi:flagellar biosynthesis/type III secretory pathway protein FliH